MLVRDVMTTSVITASPDEPAEIAYGEMHSRGIRHLLVAKGTNLLGVITDRDLGGPHGDEIRRGRPVRDLMVSNPVHGRPEMTLGEAAAKMRAHLIGSLPIVDNGKLVGIVTTYDMLEAIERGAFAGAGQSRPIARGEANERSKRELRVFDLMRQPAAIIGPTASAWNAATQMAEHGVGFLPVCEDGTAVGVLTDRDITVRVVAAGLDPVSTPVHEMMTRTVHRCPPETSLSEARRMMETKVVRRLVVTDPALMVIGIVSLDDLHALPAARISHFIT